ncbi:hypothetical protein NKH98_27065 [Mesorhizobium sp. M0833]|uniref:hypothetical protein n=1 Tax=Mesorhizobium sp. M0833 TaxID=2957009 RepID=UPI00333787D2
MNIPDWHAQQHQLLSPATDAIQAGNTARAVRSRFATDESLPSGSTRERRNLVEAQPKHAIRQRRKAVGSKLGDQNRLWKVELQQLTRETNLALHIASPSDGHIDVKQHRTPLFCRITQTCADGALLDRVTPVELIAVTTTNGPEVGARSIP